MKNQEKTDSRAISRRSNSGRRDFLRQSGTVVSAILAPAAAGIAHARSGEGERPDGGFHQDSEQFARLEDAAAIRELYQDYAAHLTAQAGQPGAQAVQLRLMQDPARRADTIAVAPDRKSATARFHCVAQTAVPLTGEGSLLDMARLQGQYAETWWESGIHELDCVRTGSGWKIRSVAYRTAGPSRARI